MCADFMANRILWWKQEYAYSYHNNYTQVYHNLIKNPNKFLSGQTHMHINLVMLPKLTFFIRNQT